MHPKVRAHLAAGHVSALERRHADFSVPITNPGDFAKALGYELDRIAKSLVVTTKDGQAAIAVCSTNRRVSFSKISRLLALGRLETAKREVLERLIGYPSGGVSPFGVSCPVVVDSALLQFETILVGAGEMGVEIELRPSDLVKATRALVAEFASI